MSASESKSALVVELAEEFLERYRRGGRPSLKEYIDRHPELAAEIKEVFPAMALMENVALADESLADDPTGAEVVRGDRVPEQLGDFRILREVGRGGMGVVYEAEQVSLGRHVALKVLPHQTHLDATQKQRFEREAKAAAKLHHTNIVPVFGVGEHDGMPYYVMQFIQGLGLDAVLEELKRLPSDGSSAAAAGEPPIASGEVSAAEAARSLRTGAFGDGERDRVSAPREPDLGALTQPRSPVDTHGALTQPRSPGDDLGALTQPRSPDRLSDTSPISSSLNLPGASRKGQKTSYWQSVARIGVQVADALDHAHQQRILHRDIKPSNLLLDREGRIWITDFGLAKADNEDHLTRTGDVVGTLRYMAPEAFDGRTDVRSEVYALGLTLYELLALRSAFDERDRHKLIKQVTTGEPPRLRKINPRLPRDLETIVHKAIDREPGRRYQTAAELSADLQHFLDDEPIKARRTSSLERLRRWGRRNKSVAVLAVLAVLLLLTVALVSSLSALSLRRQRDAIRAEQDRANEAERAALAASVESLLTASPGSVPFLLERLQAGKQEVLPDLQERVKRETEGTVPRMRLNVALAMLGENRGAELCAATARTPPEESFNLLLGLKCGDREPVARSLWSHYQEAKAGEGRARLAIALLELGDPRAARAELALTTDLSARVRFIHLSATWHGDKAALPDLLRAGDDTAFRGGLCLTVAGADAANVSPATRQALDAVLTELYTSAPEGGTHAAAEYALRRRGLDLPVIPSTQGPIQGRRWFVNRQGMTLIALRPGCFHPWDYEQAPDADGPAPQTIALPRPFFLGDQEVTAEWYRRFLDSDDHPKDEELTDAAREVDPRHPLAVVNRRAAVLFCNWLSRTEGRTPCYRPAGPGQGMYCDFTANGYRLPTDAEWEYAFRCGTTTRYFTGTDISRMLEYGRLFAPAAGPGKCFNPNPWGFFDLLGNSWEVCWDQGIDRGASGLAVNPLGAVGSSHSIRGGSHDAGLFYLHGSCRIIDKANRTQSFRVVCGPLNAEDAKDDHVAALSLLSRLMEQYPDSARELKSKRGRLYAELGRCDEAAADFGRLLEQAPLSLSIDDDFPRWDEVFGRIVAVRPRDTRLWYLHLHWLARRGRWYEAASASARLTELDPDNAHFWYYDAALRLQIDDRDGYRHDCREMLRRFADNPGASPPDLTAKTCLLRPEAGTDLTPVLRLAEYAVTGNEKDKNYRWYLLCQALADYRVGRFDAAVERIGQAEPKAEGVVLDATAYLILALGESRRGHAAEARKALAQAQAIRDRYWPQPDSGEYFDVAWDDWLRYEALRGEAQTRIEGTEPKK